MDSLGLFLIFLLYYIKSTTTCSDSVAYTWLELIDSWFTVLHPCSQQQCWSCYYMTGCLFYVLQCVPFCVPFILPCRQQIFHKCVLSKCPFHVPCIIVIVDKLYVVSSKSYNLYCNNEFLSSSLTTVQEYKGWQKKNIIIVCFTLFITIQ